MINIEIPYGTGIQIKCPSCGYEGLPDGKKKGMISLEVILYICGIFPGIIYSIWRNSSRVCCCPKCGQVSVKEINGDDELVNSLLKLNKIQNYAFVGAILIFILLIFGTRDYRLSNQNKQLSTNINTIYQQTSSNVKSYNNYPTTVDRQENKAEIKQKIEEMDEEVKKESDTSDQIRVMVQGVVDSINKTYREDYYQKNENFSGAYCVGDCVNGIINIDWKQYPYAYKYDGVVGRMASSRAVNLSFGMGKKPVTINLNIGGKLFISCSGANTVIHCEQGNYFDE